MIYSKVLINLELRFSKISLCALELWYQEIFSHAIAKPFYKIALFVRNLNLRAWSKSMVFAACFDLLTGF